MSPEVVDLRVLSDGGEELSCDFESNPWANFSPGEAGVPSCASGRSSLPCCSPPPARSDPTLAGRESPRRISRSRAMPRRPNSNEPPPDWNCSEASSPRFSPASATTRCCRRSSSSLAAIRRSSPSSRLVWWSVATQCSSPSPPDPGPCEGDHLAGEGLRLVRARRRQRVAPVRAAPGAGGRLCHLDRRPPARRH